MKICGPINLQGIAHSGQCFRWQESWARDTYSFIINGRYFQVYRDADGTYCQSDSAEDYNLLRTYFDVDTDYDEIMYQSDHTDRYLQNAIEKYRGIRILKQDLWEVIVSFIISQRKSIPSIRNCVEEICETFGDRIGRNQYSFPTPEAISAASLEDLRRCKVGYRDSYIKAAAEWFLEYGDKPPEYSELLKIPGVGPKVANCIRLFGLHDLSCCPVDTWMQRIIDTRYGGKFPKWMESPYAGVYQQYAFMYERYLAWQKSSKSR